MDGEGEERAYCCSLLSHSAEKEGEGVRYFCSRSRLRDSRSCFMRFRGRCCSERIPSIQSSALSVADSWSFSRALVRSAILFEWELPAVMLCFRVGLRVQPCRRGHRNVRVAIDELDR